MKWVALGTALAIVALGPVDHLIQPPTPRPGEHGGSKIVEEERWEDRER